MKKYFLILLVLILFITNSCIKNNTDPSWIYIDTWKLQANQTNLEGDISSHNITNAYLLIDDNVIGYFQLPIKLPILQEGTKKISIYPAINNNGISSTKRCYPFLQPYIISTNLKKNETTNLSPTTKYYTNTKFWIENFEDAGLKIQTDPNYSPVLTTGSDPAILKYGHKYGWIHLTKIDSVWLGVTQKMSLPQYGAEVFLEIDYMNTNNLFTGVNCYGNATFLSNPTIQINTQSNDSKKWKKIYIDLKEIISYSTSYYQFEQYFQAQLDTGKEFSDIYIDNIKLVYF